MKASVLSSSLHADFTFIHSFLHPLDVHPALTLNGFISFTPTVLAHWLINPPPPPLNILPCFSSDLTTLTCLLSVTSHKALHPTSCLAQPCISQKEMRHPCTHSGTTAGDYQSASYFIISLMNNSRPRKQVYDN